MSTPETEVLDPATSSARLAEIAASHPQLGSAVVGHPNAYPGLIQWIADNGDPAARTAARARLTAPAGYAPAPVRPAAPAVPGRNQAFLLLGAGAGAALLELVAAILIGAAFGSFSGGAKGMCVAAVVLVCVALVAGIAAVVLSLLPFGREAAAQGFARQVRIGQIAGFGAAAAALTTMISTFPLLGLM